MVFDLCFERVASTMLTHRNVLPWLRVNHSPVLNWTGIFISGRNRGFSELELFNSMVYHFSVEFHLLWFME